MAREEGQDNEIEEWRREHRRIFYYDCTNFLFEIEQEDDFRHFGLAKDHKSNPLVEMGLIMDAEGMQLAFCMDTGNVSEPSPARRS